MYLKRGNALLRLTPPAPDKQVRPMHMLQATGAGALLQAAQNKWLRDYLHWRERLAIAAEIGFESP